VSVIIKLLRLNHTYGCGNHTRACRSHTSCRAIILVRVLITLCVEIALYVVNSHYACRNHTCVCKNPTRACWICTLRVEMKLVRVQITLGRVFWACVSKNLFKNLHSNMSFSHVCVSIQIFFRNLSGRYVWVWWWLI
jgi:hypothetical protein